MNLVLTLLNLGVIIHRTMTATAPENGLCKRGEASGPPPNWLPANGLSAEIRQELGAHSILLVQDAAEPGYAAVRYAPGCHIHTAKDGSYPSPTTVLDSDCNPVLTAHWGDGAERLTVVQLSTL